MLPRLVFVVPALLAGSLICAPAHAEFEIPQVNVDANTIEAEYRGAAHSGVPEAEPGEEKPLRQSHELEFQLAPTDWWMYRLTPGLTQVSGGDLEFRDLSIETQFVLHRRPGDGYGLAFMFGYISHFQSAREEPDEFEYGPIFEYASGPWLLTLNPMLNLERGNFAKDGTGFEYASQLEYRFAEHWSIAALAFGEIEELAHSGPLDDQTHQAGPTLYYLIGESEEELYEPELEGPGRKTAWRIGLGLLFGLTPATTDLSVKAMAALEY
ncbi:hypothetical protein V6C03_01165 [Methyloligella sp. 2.7D]|uniref:hypothetical protein n=1 Tax=unclassified Methyloligella TaxID=2625955 RepID=UPI00157DBE2E|nr:hypothetical protein [Methyloligella sp. GL2]QKP76729.1 hypothetical protein HT051_04250 [Methyloligella sp. GL2]